MMSNPFARRRWSAVLFAGLTACAAPAQPPREKAIPHEKTARPAERASAPETKPPVIEEQKVFLRELVPIAKEHWPMGPPPGGGPEGKMGPPPGGGSEGKAAPPPRLIDEVNVHSMNYPNGIFMHPPVPPNDGKPASLSYRLPKQVTRFKATVSLNDGPERANTPVTFSVYGDGKLLWKSKPVTTQKDGQAVDISVQNVNVIKLQVICAGDPRGAHAVWIDPHVTSKSIPAQSRP